MTIQDLIDAIAEALFQQFGSGYEIYTEKVEQGLQEPCFLLRCLNPTKYRHLGRVYLRTNDFAIQYFPSTTEAYEECNSVMERLFECLESVIVLGKPVHGTELNGQITDDILTVTVSYNGFVLKEETVEPNMNALTVETEAKG